MELWCFSLSLADQSLWAKYNPYYHLLPNKGAGDLRLCDAIVMRRSITSPITKLSWFCRMWSPYLSYFCVMSIVEPGYTCYEVLKDTIYLNSRRSPKSYITIGLFSTLRGHQVFVSIVSRHFLLIWFHLCCKRGPCSIPLHANSRWPRRGRRLGRQAQPTEGLQRKSGEIHSICQSPGL